MFKEKIIIFIRRLSESFPACLFVMVKGDECAYSGSLGGGFKDGLADSSCYGWPIIF